MRAVVPAVVAGRPNNIPSQTIMMRTSYLCVLVFLLFCGFAQAQRDTTRFIDEPDHFVPWRFWSLMGVTTTGYTATVVGLNELWYAQYPRGGFRFFNDKNEWLQMDKVGHAVAAYQEARIGHDLMLWSGVRPNRAVWAGFAISTVMQGTIEMLDAYSVAWGFSMYDIAFNTGGGLLFAGQQWAWNEQRMLLKINALPPRYPNVFISSTDGLTEVNLRERAHNIYGTSLPSILLKDYNAVAYWLSISPRCFMPDSRWPAWLNVAVGYSAESMYSARRDTWEKDGSTFIVPAPYQAYRQFGLSPDIYWSKIPTRSKWLHAFLSCLDIVKLPAPALMYEEQRGFRVGVF